MKSSNSETRKEKIGNREIEYFIDSHTKWPHTSILTGKIHIGEKFINLTDKKTLKAILAHEAYHSLSHKTMRNYLIVLALIILLSMILIMLAIIVIYLSLNEYYQLVYFAILSLSIFLSIVVLCRLLNLYSIRSNEKAADIYAVILVGKSTVINSLKKLEELKKSKMFEPSSLKCTYEFTHGKFEERMEFIKNLGDFQKL